MKSEADGQPVESAAGRPTASVDDLRRLDIRAGRVVRAEAFPAARNPAIRLWVDFGDPIGVRASSAQLTRRYTPRALVGRMIIAVVNLPPIRVAGFRSEVLVLGVTNPADPADVVLVVPEAEVQGWRLA